MYERLYSSRDYVIARKKAYRERPEVKAREKQRWQEYYEKRHEEINAIQREYYEKNKEKIKARRCAYQNGYSHRPEVKARRREYLRQDRLLHPEKYKAYEEKRKEKRREQYRLKKQKQKEQKQ